MKIYCNDANSTTATPFDKYIDTGLWVKCVLSYNPKYVFYARFLDKEVDNFDNGEIYVTIRFNQLKLPNGVSQEEVVQRYPLQCEVGSKEFRLLTTEIHDKYADSLKLAHPVDVRTDEELFGVGDVDVDSTSELDRFVGKDLWVLMELTALHHPQNLYVRLYSKNGFNYEYKGLPLRWFDDMSQYEFDAHYNYIQDGSLSVSHIDTFEIVHPMDVLSTDEILELLESYVDSDFYDEDEDDFEDEE